MKKKLVRRKNIVFNMGTNESFSKISFLERIKIAFINLLLPSGFSFEVWDFTYKDGFMIDRKPEKKK